MRPLATGQRLSAVRHQLTHTCAHDVFWRSCAAQTRDFTAFAFWSLFGLEWLFTFGLLLNSDKLGQRVLISQRLAV